ncbi:MAG TPA: 6-phosphogluconolactonase [Chthoniobacteraceae bacterium]|jgi:6-phosphogluconolactonase|nr:6-phosphogluconolactonase [Chthoniobacteraceae bacterium]
MPTTLHTTDFPSDAANIILSSAREAIAARGIFRIALSGGRTPAAVYRQWAAAAGDFPWDRVQITFGDERCVPPNDEQSNYRMARTTLLDAVPIPPGNVFRMRGELPAGEAAGEYDARLAQLASRFNEPRYRHDLLLLGMGPDGHTASLFPGTEALHEQTRNVVHNFVPKFDTYRITFTFPLIDAARHVLFMVEGDEKKPVVDQILAGGADYPAARVAPTDGKLTWLLGWP